MEKTYWSRFYAWDNEQGYTVDVPDLGCATTEGSNWEEAVYMAKEMVAGYLEVCLRDGDPLPNSSPKEEVEGLETPSDMAAIKLVEISVYIDDARALLSAAIWDDLDKVSRQKGLPVHEILSRAARTYLARDRNQGVIPDPVKQLATNPSLTPPIRPFKGKLLLEPPKSPQDNPPDQVRSFRGKALPPLKE